MKMRQHRRAWIFCGVRRLSRWVGGNDFKVLRERVVRVRSWNVVKRDM